MNITQWFRGLRARLLLIAFIPLIALLLVAYEGYTSAHNLGNFLEVAVNDDLPTTMYRGEMDAAIHTMVMSLLNAYSISGDNIKARDEAIKYAEHEVERFKKAEALYEKLKHSETETKLYQPIHDNWPAVEKDFEHVVGLLKKHNPNDNEKAKEIIHNELLRDMHVIDQAFEKLDEFQVEELAKEQKHAEAEEQQSYKMIILFSAVGFVIALFFAITIAIRVAKALDSISKSLTESANQVASASTQIASSSEELSQASTEQASSLEETAASLEEISAMITKATDNAQTTATSSGESQQKAEEGRTAADQMLSSMNEISQSNEAIMAQINESNKQMTEIVKVIQDIGNKTKVINEIVFQTKLLSFNASVEAARAGEHGKGFAVVAEEVGNLAQMSGNAAKEISDMLDGSILKVEKIVTDTKTRVESLVEQGKQKVESGINVARQCSDVLNEIVQNVSKVSALSQEISQASKEQAQGVGEINKAMGQLDTVTQQNAATSEEAASAAEQLSAQAETLKTVVHELIVIIQGNDSQEKGADFVQKSSPKASVKRNSSNLVHIKSSKKTASSNGGANGAQSKAAAFGDFVPSRDDDGFKDI